MDTSTQILNIDRIKERFSKLSKEYNTEDPYPHIVIDDFLNTSNAEKLLDAFPKVKEDGWIHYVHYNEKKHGLNKTQLLPPYIRQVIEELNSDEFVQVLSDLTGIKNLKADEMLEGGGLHQTMRGGFLNVHADFTVHPHKPKWQRRVNLLIYFNKDWKEEYEGKLELWSRDMKECRKSVLPIFNRCVIFNTDADSYHGLPDPIQCPEDNSRKSIALYYFTEEKNPIKSATNYKARPGDGFRAWLIYLDKKAVAFYSTMKGILGINDDFISKILNVFSKKK